MKQLSETGPAVLALATLCLCPTAAIHASPPVSASLKPYQVTRAVISGEDLTQVGLIYRAPRRNSSEPVPGVVVLHGWAPAGTVGAALVAELAFEFQQAGYAALALSLRGWPETGGHDDCGGRQPDDAAEAIHWLARQPGVDPRRIGLVGHSQGGQVALLAGAGDAPVAAVVAYAPVTDLELWGTMTHVPGILEYLKDDCSRGAGLTSRSPVRVAHRMRAPVLLLHGTKDTRVHLLQSIQLADAMERAGKSVELVKVHDAGHHWSELGGARSALGFLKRTLGP